MWNGYVSEYSFSASQKQERTNKKIVPKRKFEHANSFVWWDQIAATTGVYSIRVTISIAAQQSWTPRLRTATREHFVD
jgi:hypothetical protein